MGYLSCSVQNLPNENVVKCPGQFRTRFRKHLFHTWLLPYSTWTPVHLRSVVLLSSMGYLSCSVQNLPNENVVKCPGQFRTRFRKHLFHTWLLPYSTWTPVHLRSVVLLSSVRYLSCSVQNLPNENVVKCPGQFRTKFRKHLFHTWLLPYSTWTPVHLRSVVLLSSMGYLSCSVQNLPNENVVKCPGQFRTKFRKHLFHTWLLPYSTWTPVHLRSVVLLSSMGYLSCSVQNLPNENVVKCPGQFRTRFRKHLFHTWLLPYSTWTPVHLRSVVLLSSMGYLSCSVQNLPNENVVKCPGQFRTKFRKHLFHTPVHLRSVVLLSSMGYLSCSVQNLPNENVVKCPGQFRTRFRKHLFHTWLLPYSTWTPVHLRSVVLLSSMGYLSCSVQNLPNENVVKCPGQFRTKFRKHLFHTWLLPYSTWTPVHLRSVVLLSSMGYLSCSVQNLPNENVVKCPGQFRTRFRKHLFHTWLLPYSTWTPVHLRSVVLLSSVRYLSCSVQNLSRENVVKCPGQFRTKFRKHLFHTWLLPYSTWTPVHLRSVVLLSSMGYLSCSVQNLSKENVVKCPRQLWTIYFILGWCHT